MLLTHLMNAAETCAPLCYAESWDNVGLLLGHPGSPISRCLVTIDLTDAVLQEALAWGAELVMAYHPPWFAAKKRLVGDDLLLKAARAGLCIYSPHTALDAALLGTNDVLADAAAVLREGRGPLVEATAQSTMGMGRVGDLAEAQNFAPWLERLKQRMGVTGALVALVPGSEDEPPPVRRVAVCAGAGDGLWQKALTARADTFVTGELRHHHALAAIAQNMRVVALLHSGSERAAMASYAARMQQLAPDVTFRVSTIDRDPYEFL